MYIYIERERCLQTNKRTACMEISAANPIEPNGQLWSQCMEKTDPRPQPNSNNRKRKGYPKASELN